MRASRDASKSDPFVGVSLARGEERSAECRQGQLSGCHAGGGGGLHLTRTC